MAILGNQTTQRQLPKELHLTLAQEMAVSHLSLTQRVGLQRLAKDISRKGSAVGMGARLVQLTSGSGIGTDVLVQLVMRETYLGSESDLRDAAEKMKSCHRQKNAIRERLKRYRDIRMQLTRETSSSSRERGNR